MPSPKTIALRDLECRLQPNTRKARHHRARLKLDSEYAKDAAMSWLRDDARAPTTGDERAPQVVPPASDTPS